MPFLRSLWNAGKPQIWPISLSQNSAKIEKWTDRKQNLISSEAHRDTSACEIAGHSFDVFSGKSPETSPHRRPNKRSGLGGWTNGKMYGWKEPISGFKRRIGRADKQPKNIMHRAPKGGGIKVEWNTILSAQIRYSNLVRSGYSTNNKVTHFLAKFSLGIFDFRIL